MDTHRDQLPAVFAALADPTRLAVVERLADGPLPVSRLAEPFAMAGPSFLKHLRILEAAGLVTTEKRGRVRLVTLAAEPLGWVDRWIDRQRRRWDRRLDRLAATAEEAGAAA